MKKLLGLICLFTLLAVSLAIASLSFEEAKLGPADAKTGDVLTGNITCESNVTITAYWNVYRGTDNVTALAGNQNIFNDTETGVITVPTSYTAKGEVWRFIGWCQNSEGEITTQTTSNTVTIANTAPVATFASISPSTATSETLFTCSGISDDADDADTLTQSYQFMNGATVVRAWSTSSTFQCTSSLCPVAASIKCQYKVNDGSIDSNVVNSTSVVIDSPASSIDINGISFGGSTSEKSNPDDEDAPVLVTETLTVRNTGTNPLTSLTFSNVNIASKYNISFTPSAIASLAPGASTTITVKANLHEEHDAFDPDANTPQDDRDMLIGSIMATASDGTQDVTDTADVRMETENKLEIYRLYIEVDNDSDKVNDGDTVEDIPPGAKIEVRLIAETGYSSGSDVDLENIELTILIDDGDIDEEENDDIPDIDAGDDNEETTISFTIDDDVDEDTYVMIVTLEGEDSYGAIHGEQWEIELEVKREDEEITIKSASLSPDTISCQRTSTLSIRIENSGNDDSDEITLEVKNDALGIFSRTRDIDLDNDDDYSKTIPISVGDTVPAGTYSINIFTYFDDDAYEDDDVSKFRSVDLIVQSCGSTVVDDDDDDVDDTDDGDDSTTVIVDTSLDDTVDDSTTTGGSAVARPPATITGPGEDTLTLALIILGYVVVIIVAVVLIAKLFKK